MKKLRFIIVVAILAVSVFTLAACNTDEYYFVFGVTLEIRTEGSGGKNYTDYVYDYMLKLEALASPTAEGSEIKKINDAKAGETVTVSDDTAALLRIASEVYAETDGAYDPSVYPLVRLWGFGGDQFSLSGVKKEPPSDADVQKTLELVGLDEAFDFSDDYKSVTKLKDGAMLDLGGIAKGYAVEKAVSFAGDKLNALINLGGTIACVNKQFIIGVANPRPADAAYFGSFTAQDGECVSTSGDYERYYKYESGEGDDRQVVRYHHIINPKTGYPVDTSDGGAVISATVICADGARADALSTAFVVMGKDKAMTYANEKNLKVVLITGDLQHYVTDNLDFAKK